MPHFANIGNPDLDYLFDVGNKKHNSNIKYLPGDNFPKTKVLSKEPYAQELYERYTQSFRKINDSGLLSKDLELNKLYTVIITNIDFQDKIIRSEIIGNGIPIYIPFSEFHISMEDIIGKEHPVIVYANKNGVFYGSFKKYAQIDYLQEVVDSYKKNDWFYVKIKSLIDGGYIAEYKETVSCFLPGGQAAANIINDFDRLIGKTIAVLVDSYDTSSKLYIVSHKKYIKKVLPFKINELEFGKKYVGTLTSNPTNFGLFIEIEDFFTGLAHKMDFDDYDSIKRKYSAFDNIDVYVKDITIDKYGKHRILITTNPKSVNVNKEIYSALNKNYKNKILNFTHNKNDSTVTIITDDEDITIPVSWKFVEKYINYGFKHLVIKDIDVIREKIYFEFMR